MDQNKLGWDMSEDKKTVLVTYEGKVFMQLDVMSIVEASSRNYILKHVIECDNTPWLKDWQAEKQIAYEDGLERTAVILRGIS